MSILLLLFFVLRGNLFEFLDYNLSDIHDQFIFVIIEAKTFQNWERSLHSVGEWILEREADKEKHVGDPPFSTVEEKSHLTNNFLRKEIQEKVKSNLPIKNPEISLNYLVLKGSTIIKSI